MDMVKLITEMETIVFSGTKLNIDYWINDIFDDDQIDELTNYFMKQTQTICIWPPINLMVIMRKRSCGYFD